MALANKKYEPWETGRTANPSSTDPPSKDACAQSSCDRLVHCSGEEGDHMADQRIPKY